MTPSPPDPGEITRLLDSWAAGDRSAFEELFPLLYPQLKRIADRQLRGERPGHTLQPTALVHEAFLASVLATRSEFEARRGEPQAAQAALAEALAIRRRLAKESPDFASNRSPLADLERRSQRQ